MAKALVGEAAIRIVPTLRGFKPEADRRLRAMTFDPVEVQIDPDFKRASAEMKAWRAKERLNAINVPVKADFSESRASFAAFRRELTTVEHIFKRSALQRAIRLNVKIIGLDALPALASAAGSATAGVDALGKALFALPGIAGGALASIGALAVGLRGVGEAFQAYKDTTKNAAQAARDVESANRDIQRSYRDYRSAVRDTVREIQDLNAENRRSSLNVADAVLSVQEAADRLRQGGQKSLLELRRDQLSYLQAVDHLQEVQTKAKRTAQDTAEANARGVSGADAVVDALDRIADATDRLEKSQSGSNPFRDQLGKLAPEAQKAIAAVVSFEGAWNKLTHSVQNNLFDGIDRAVIDLGQKALPGLEVGLSRVASGINANFKTVAESLGGDTSQGLIERIFGNTDGGLQNLSRAMNPLIEGVLRLTKESSDFLPRLGEAAEKVFTRFDDWTKRISKDGSLDQWIDRGLNALTSLGNAAVNIGSIISSVSKAFEAAGGDKGGFVTTLENATKRLADFLSSAEGQNDLIDYFKQARHFIGELGAAINNMKPFIKDAVEVARDWSVVLFTVAGALAKAAWWIEENTGLLKYLLGGYLLFRTVAPLVNGATTAWKNYNVALERAANSHNSPGWLRQNSFLQWTARQARIAKGDVDALRTSMQATQTAATATASMSSHVAASSTAAAVVSDRAGERERRAAAGIGLSSTPLRDRLDAANAAFLSRQAAKAVDNSTLGAPPAALAAVQTRLSEADRRKAAGIGLSAMPLPQRLADARAAREAKLRAERLAPLDYRRTYNTADMRGGNLPSWRQRPTGLSATPYGPALPPLFGETQKSRALGAMQGPALPPGFGKGANANAFFEVKSPGMGAVQGPALPPDVFKRIGDEAEQAAPKVQSVADASKNAGAVITDAGTSADKTTPKLRGVGVSAADTARDLGALNTAGRNTARAMGAAGDGAVIAKSKVADLGDEASTSGDKVGNRTIGLVGRLAGFAGALAGPAALSVGLVAVMGLVDKLGEAHRNAARDAKAQEDALRNLATTLDETTGAFTRRTQFETAKTFENYAIPGFGDKNNINQILSNLRIDPRAAIAAAADPTQGQAFRGRQDELYKQIADQIQNSESYKNNKAAFDTYGLDPMTLARALGSESDALQKVRDARDKPQYEYDTEGNRMAITIPDLTRLAMSLPNKDAFMAAFALQNVNASQVAQGATNANASRAAAGPQELTPQGANEFGRFAPNLGSLTRDVTGSGIVQVNSPVDPATLKRWEDLNFEVGEDPGNGIRQVKIPADIVDQYLKTLPAFRDGGLVRGPGGPRSDSILARVSDYEHIANADAVRYYGVELFDALNRKALPRFAGGGWPGFIPQTPANTTPFDPNPLPIQQAATPPAPPVAPPVAPPAPVLAPPAVSTPAETFSAPTSVPKATTHLPNATPSVPGYMQLPGGGSSGFVPEAYGLEAGSAISYGAQGFPTWVYALGERFGVEPSTYRGHQEGSGANKGIDWRPVGLDPASPEGAAVMEQFAKYLNSIPGAEQIIFENAATGSRVGRDPGDRGANQSIDDYYRDDWAGHRDHVHTRFSQSVPLPEQLGMLMQNPSLLSAMPGGGLAKNLSPMEALKAKWDDFFNFEKRYANAWAPENAINFLAGQANSVGSSLLGIGTQFLSGITGINFGELLGPGQAIANEFLGGSGDGSSSGGNGEDVAGVAMDQFMQGIPGIGGDLQASLDGFNPALSAKGKKGGDAYRPLVRQVLQQVAARYGITNVQAWEDALVKQIDTESGGDPFSLNENDSNGQGGTQTVKGLLNFLPTTFNAHNVFGGEINDPAAQIAAAIDYLCTDPKYDGGIAADGGPVQIGRGTGFKNGGFPAAGLAWLSNGEYRTGAAATRHYGPALFDALNRRAIPREAIGRFAEGGWPLLQPQPVPGQAPGPLPGPAPAPAPAGLGPGLLAPPGVGAVPSTGGAPGPGATAPAPDPGVLPGVTDAMSAIGGMGAALGGGGGGGLSQPGATGPQAGDPRSVLGAAPVSNEHTNPALKAGISGAFNTVGSLAATAASMAGAAGTMGMGGASGGAAIGAGIQAGAQIAGAVATGAVNVLSSLLVGTATNGSTQSASGTPLLPQRQPQTAGVPQMVQRVHNGDINVTNLDEYKRQQQVMDAQAAMPFIGKYG
ncbi:tape measure protein [Mycobacterium phage Nanosmite]|nr:tape measure protein [Mycobacterium phage Nanosmite]